MNKIAEDIIFLKDNLDKGDPRSLESIRKRNLEKEQSVKNYWGGAVHCCADCSRDFFLSGAEFC